MRIRLFVLAGIVLTSAATYASSSRGDEQAADAAFARLKTLAGQCMAGNRFRAALECACSEPERRLLTRRLDGVRAKTRSA